MSEYKKGETYKCADPNCNMEVTVQRSCSGEVCSDCGPLMCCDKPMVKTS